MEKVRKPDFIERVVKYGVKICDGAYIYFDYIVLMHEARIRDVVKILNEKLKDVNLSVVVKKMIYHDNKIRVYSFILKYNPVY